MPHFLTWLLSPLKMKVQLYLLLIASVFIAGLVQASDPELQDDDWLDTVFKSTLGSLLLKGISDGTSKVTSKTMTTVTIVEPGNKTKTSTSSSDSLPSYKVDKKHSLSHSMDLDDLSHDEDSSEDDEDALHDVIERLFKKTDTASTTPSSPLLSYFKSVVSPFNKPVFRKPSSLFVFPDFVDFFLPTSYKHKPTTTATTTTTEKPCDRNKPNKLKKKRTTTTYRPTTEYITYQPTKMYPPLYPSLEMFQTTTTTWKPASLLDLPLGPVRPLQSNFDFHVPRDSYAPNSTTTSAPHLSGWQSNSYDPDKEIIHFEEELPESTPYLPPFRIEDEPFGSFVSQERKNSKVNITAT